MGAGYGYGYGAGKRAVAAHIKGVRYSNEANALFARMSVQPSTERKTLYDDLIASMKAAGLWEKLDAFYLMAAHDTHAARLNLIADQYNLMLVGSPVFTVDRGFQGDGAITHMSTGFNPVTAVSPNFTQNSAHMGVYSRTDASGSTVDIGSRATATTSQATVVLKASGVYSVRMNVDTSPTGITMVNSLGHFVGSRTAVNATRSFKNGSNTQFLTDASVPPYNGNFFIGAINQGGAATNRTARQYAAAHIGSGLSIQQVADLYAVLTTYLTAIGANV